MTLNLADFFAQLQDYLAPKLDTYEQAIYLYVFRHSRLLGLPEVTIGFKSARTRMACGIGEKGKPMSENTAYVKLQSLQAKGCLEILATERNGRRVRLHLPTEIPDLIRPEVGMATPDPEQIDYFATDKGRAAILERESGRCFYCLRKIDGTTYVIEHVVSRPAGDSNYRNVVAGSRQCNNRKGSMVSLRQACAGQGRSARGHRSGPALCWA